MSQIRKIVESIASPSVHDLWLKDGVLYQFDTTGWVPINKITDEDLEALRKDVIDEITRSIGEDLAFKDDLQEIIKKINEEISNRETADDNLQDSIDNLTEALSKEQSDRKSEDSILQENIETVSNNLSEEIASREQEDENIRQSITTHVDDTSNPHKVTKSQVGLGNVDNTSDANKPISTATQQALNTKQDTLVSGTNIKTLNGQSLLGSGDITIDLSLYKVVTTLPTEDIDTNKIYLVLSTESEEANVYTEYVYVEDSWEKLGEYKAEVDLTPYLTKEEAADTYTTKEETVALQEAHDALQDKVEEAGGVYNYLENTIYPVWSFENAAGTQEDIEDTTIPSGIYHRITFTMDDSGGVYNYTSNTQKLLPNEDYSWSIMIRTSKEITLTIGREQTNGGNGNYGHKQVTIPANQWTIVTNTWTPTEVDLNLKVNTAFCIYSILPERFNDGDTLDIAMPMWVKGSLPKDYAVNPRDPNFAKYIGAMLNNGTDYKGNLNTLVQSGFYRVALESTNKPRSNSGGTLIVQARDTGGYSTQIYIEDTTGDIYSRGDNTGTASITTAWNRIINNSDTTNIITHLPKDGGMYSTYDEMLEAVNTESELKDDVISGYGIDAAPKIISVSYLDDRYNNICKTTIIQAVTGGQITQYWMDPFNILVREKKYPLASNEWTDLIPMTPGCYGDKTAVGLMTVEQKEKLESLENTPRTQRVIQLGTFENKTLAFAALNTEGEATDDPIDSAEVDSASKVMAISYYDNDKSKWMKGIVIQSSTDNYIVQTFHVGNQILVRSRMYPFNSHEWDNDWKEYLPNCFGDGNAGLMTYEEKLRLQSIDTDPKNQLAYGVSWNINDSSPLLNRIGNVDLHKQLPIQSGMKGCICRGKTLVYYLDPDDWRFKEGVDSITLDVTISEGTDGILGTSSVDKWTVPWNDGSMYNYMKLEDTNGDYGIYLVSHHASDTLTLHLDTLEESSDGWSDTARTITGCKVRFGSNLSGYDGTVEVEIPEFYLWSESEGDERKVYISTSKITSTAERIPHMFLDAFKATVLNTVPENMGYLSTLPVNSAISVVNTNTYCRGGSNSSSTDQYLEENPLRSNLGKPRSSVTRANMRIYAENAGKEILCYKYYKAIFYWLWVIEYANFNVQSSFNSSLTSEGFRQGGLGAGLVSLNGLNYNTIPIQPITPCGYSKEMGNSTGVKQAIIKPYTITYNQTPLYAWGMVRYQYYDSADHTNKYIVDGSGVSSSYTTTITAVHNTANAFGADNWCGDRVIEISGLTDGQTVIFNTGDIISTDGQHTIEIPKPISLTIKFGKIQESCNIVIKGISTSATEVTTNQATINTTRWRGIENPFGDTWTNLDGAIIVTTDENYTEKNVYTTTNSQYFGDDEEALSHMSISGKQIYKDGYIKSFDLGNTAEIIPNQVGGSTSSYMCDYNYVGGNSTSYRTLLVGGTATTGSTAGLGYFYSSHGVAYSWSSASLRCLTIIN